MTQTEWESRFIKWVEARDDDWWEKGQGHISIWDVRVMHDFFLEELASQRTELLDEFEKIIGELKKHRKLLHKDHKGNMKEENYCDACAESDMTIEICRHALAQVRKGEK